MGVGKWIDFTNQFNTVYGINQDLSGWDQVTIQVVAPISGTIFVYGTNDAGAQIGITQGNAKLATNWQPIQATNLANGSNVSSIAAGGLFKVTANVQFLQLQGNPAATPTNVYKLLLFNYKSD